MKKIVFLGRTNAGKSTLLNALMKVKIAAISNKVHTTRKPLTGIFKHGQEKWLLLDAPGLCRPRSVLDRIMFNNLRAVLEAGDLVWWIIDIEEKGGNDMQILLDLLQKTAKPTFLVINKTDLVDSEKVLQKIKTWEKVYNFKSIIPISAHKKHNFANLIRASEEFLTELPDRENDFSPSSFLEITKEIIREQIVEQTNDEIPHQTCLILQKKQKTNSGYTFFWNILVNNPSQKAIILGKEGNKIKNIRQQSEKKLTEIWKTKIVLSFFVKVEPNWFQKEKILQLLGLKWEKS